MGAMVQGACEGRAVRGGAAPGRTVLVVEDEALIREMIVEALADGDDLRVLAAASASEALRLLETDEIDMLFTDIDLGPGPDGFEVARLAGARRPALSVVYTSGRLGGPDERALPGAGFVPKPYRPTQVCDRLRALLPAGPG